MRKGIFMSAVLSLTAIAAYGEYTLKVSNGKLPEGVTTDNINGKIPLKNGYKNGWTDNGWTTGDYGQTRNALLAPSFLANGDVCESALSLPILTIEPGEWLYWKSRAVYPIREEQHSVEIRIKGEEDWNVICMATDSGSEWNQRMADLSEYAGKECEVRFVCRSEHGYMLALNSIRISAPADCEFDVKNKTPQFFGSDEAEDGCIPVSLEATNLGKTLKNATVILQKDGTSVTEEKYGEEWKTGESINLSLPLPIALNERADYRIVIKTDEDNEQSIDENFAFLSSIKRYMLVDKGTGMWCNNCPVGTLKIDDLERTYGESLITVETHNGDLLANDIYFNWLGYRAIPRLELDRNKSTAGENDKYFKDYICVPTEIGITINRVTNNEDGSLNVSADVRTSELFTDTDRTYRIGYVLTRDVDGTENMQYYQSNSCTIAQYQQYYYLPSTITAPLCLFPNTSLPSPLASNSNDIAFTGIEGSLPTTLEAGHSYNTTWDIPLPTGYTNFDGIRLVAYILDAGSKKIANSTAIYVDNYTGVETIGIDKDPCFNDMIFSIDGRAMGKTTDGLASGIYIMDGKKVKL